MQDALWLGCNSVSDLYISVSEIDSVGFDYYAFLVDHDGETVEEKMGFCEHEKAQELEDSLLELLA